MPFARYVTPAEHSSASRNLSDRADNAVPATRKWAADVVRGSASTALRYSVSRDAVPVPSLTVTKPLLAARVAFGPWWCGGDAAGCLVDPWQGDALGEPLGAVPLLDHLV
jgi:hypothetical protein